MTLTKASAAIAALLAATAASAAPAPNASSAWRTGALDTGRLTSQIRASVANTFRGTGDVNGSANMFPCPMPPIGPHGPIGGGSVSGTADLSGDIAVASEDGKSHGTIHVTGVIWLDGFCTSGMGQPGLVSGIGAVSGSGPVYGADGKQLGTLKVSGSASVSGSAWNVSGSVDVKGSL